MSENIKKLTPYEHVRTKTEMYFSSRDDHTQEIVIYDENFFPIIKEVTWTPALFTCFREIIDNSLDEIVGHGFGDTIKIKFDEYKPGYLYVEDNGRGVPIDFDQENNKHKTTLVFSEIMTGRNFDSREGVVGTNGIGASGVNFVSSYFNVTVYRNNKRFIQKFKENPNGKNLIIEKPLISDILSNRSGTIVEFELSDLVFKQKKISKEFLFSRLVDISLANPNIKIYFNDKLIKINKDFDKNFIKNEKIIIELQNQNHYIKIYIVPNYFNDGKDFCWSVVNSIPMFNGGIHVDKFKYYFIQNMIETLQSESKKRKITLNRNDIFENCYIYIILKTKSPNFDSQSKTRLINEDIGEWIKIFLSNENIYKNIIKKYNWWIEDIFRRAEIKNNLKENKETSKIIKKTLSGKIPDLIDATSKDRKNTILFLAEGKSAIGGLTSVRNPEIHGGLPLRGKIINVFGEKPKVVLDNQELTNIINAVGLNPLNKNVNIEELRYKKIYIATDMDYDGNSIACLLINFFYYFWPSLFYLKEPFLYLFQTPYVILIKGKQRKYFYSDDYDLFNPSDWKDWQIRRAKGLGTLTKEDWKYSLDNPKLIPIKYDEDFEKIIDLIFNSNNSDKRKEWMGI